MALTLFLGGFSLITGLGYRSLFTRVTPAIPSPSSYLEAPGPQDVFSAELCLEQILYPGIEMAFAPQPQLESSLTTIEGLLKSGDNLYSALATEGIDYQVIKMIEDRLSPFFNFRRARPGDRFKISFNPLHTMTEFFYQSGPLNLYRINRSGSDYLTEKIPVHPEQKIALVQGEISRSLFESITAQNELSQLALDFADLLSWDIDFSIDPRPGDRYRILVEKLYLDGKFYQYGNILAAQYQNPHQTYTAIFFEAPNGQGGYYDLDGESIRRSFLKSPLKFSRISSGYTNRRYHPILKRYRPHHGIDYAAPRGTPVWAVGDGTVIHRGWLGQAGKAIRIRHPNGYVSSYGHLSRYARGIRKGKKVNQKQVIGFVGSTGLATGPHLDFRMKKNGKFVNPLGIKRPRTRSVKTQYLDEFKAYRDKIIISLETSNPDLIFARTEPPPRISSLH